MQTRRLKLLMAVSFFAALAFLVVFAFAHANVTQARAVFAANPYWAKPVDDLIYVMTEGLHIAWLIWGAAGLLSWSCAFAARRIASVPTHWGTAYNHRAPVA